MSDVAKHNANGERFFNLLISFLQQHEKEIKRGILVFSLNPTCMMYLNSVFRGNTKISSPKIKKDDLVEVEAFVSELISLKVDPNVPRMLEKHKSIDLSPFRNLRILEINYCKPSLITNLAQLSTRLIKLSVHHSIVALNELLSVEDDDPSLSKPSLLSLSSPSAAPSPARSPSLDNVNTQCWFNLRFLDCSQNFAPRIDSSITTLTRVEKLDLSNNLITKVENLQYCIYMSELNLSYNRLNSVTHINETVGSVKILNLKNNLLESAEGLDKLYALESLDLSNNALKDLNSVKMLGSLPLLNKLYLAGNPLIVLANHRVSILSLFDQPILLDGQEANEEERTMLLAMKQSEAPAKKKKAPRKRVATIEEISPSEEDCADRIVDQHSVDKEYDELRKNLGEQWLNILNQEMHRDVLSPPQGVTSPPISPTKAPQAKNNPPALSLSPNVSSSSTVHSLQDNNNNTNVHNHATDNTNKSTHSENLVAHSHNPPHHSSETHSQDVPTSPRSISVPTSPINATPTSKLNPASFAPLEPQISSSSSHVDSKESVQANIPPTIAPTSVSHASTIPPASAQRLSSSPPKAHPAQTLHQPSPSKTTLLEEEGEPTETFIVLREDQSGIVERFLEIKQNKILEVDINGTRVHEFEVKDLHNIKDISRGNELAVEISTRTWSGTTEGGLQITIYKYIVNKAEEKQQLIDCLTPLLIKKFIKCGNCSTVFDALSIESNKCIKCGSSFLIEYSNPQQNSRLSVMVPSPTESSESSSKNFSAPTTPATVVQTPTIAPPKLDITQPHIDEDFDTIYQDCVRTELNFQTYLKLSVFMNANDENFVYMFRTTYIKYGASMDSESVIYILLSSKGLYLLKYDKADKSNEGFSVLLKQPLGRLRRVVIGLFYQLFRLEIDTNAAASTSPNAATTAFTFLPRSHQRTHKFIEVLTATVKGSSDTFDPPEVIYALRDSLYNINVCLMVPALDVQLYVMVYYRSKYHKGLITRSLVLSRERAYLCTEDYSKWPSSSNSYIQFESPEFTTQAKMEHAKLSWRKLGGKSVSVQFEPHLTRDMRDITQIQITQNGTDLIIQFEDEDESEGSVKESKNKPREWELVTSHPQELSRTVKMIALLWKNLFRIDLPIVQKG